MSISFVGALSSGNATTLALPTGTVEGDLAVVLATRSNATPPSIPLDWTDDGTSNSGGLSGVVQTTRCGWKILTAADTDTTVVVPTQSDLSSSWQLALGSHRNPGALAIRDIVLADYTNRSTGLATAAIGFWDSDGPTTGITAKTATCSNSAGNSGRTFEIVEIEEEQEPMAVTSSQDMPERGVTRIVATLTAQNDVLNFQMQRMSAMSIQAEGVSAGDVDLNASNNGVDYYPLPTAVTLAADGIESVAKEDLGFLNYQILLKTASETVVVTVVGMAQR